MKKLAYVFNLVYPILFMMAMALANYAAIVTVQDFGTIGKFGVYLLLVWVDIITVIGTVKEFMEAFK